MSRDDKYDIVQWGKRNQDPVEKDKSKETMDKIKTILQKAVWIKREDLNIQINDKVDKLDIRLIMAHVDRWIKEWNYWNAIDGQGRHGGVVEGYGRRMFWSCNGKTIYVSFQHEGIWASPKKEENPMTTMYNEYVVKWHKEHDEGSPACYSEWVGMEVAEGQKEEQK